MSLIPMYRRCPRCGRIYSYNPDVGQLSCPNCGLSFLQSVVKTIFKATQ